MLGKNRENIRFALNEERVVEMQQREIKKYVIGLQQRKSQKHMTELKKSKPKRKMLQIARI